MKMKKCWILAVVVVGFVMVGCVEMFGATLDIDKVTFFPFEFKIIDKVTRKSISDVKIECFWEGKKLLTFDEVIKLTEDTNKPGSFSVVFQTEQKESDEKGIVENALIFGSHQGWTASVTKRERKKTLGERLLRFTFSHPIYQKKCKTYKVKELFNTSQIELVKLSDITTDDKIAIVQKWLGLIKNESQDICMASHLMDVPYSQDGHIVLDKNELTNGCKRMRDLFNNKELVITYDNFELLSKSRIKELFVNWGHANKYEAIKDKIDCMVLFELKCVLKSFGEENIDGCFVGLSKNDKIISFFD